MKDKIYEVGFIGLGKLGHPVAKCIAEQGHRVYGVDPVEFETDEKVSLHRVDTISALALINLDFIFISVPTPHEEKFDGRIPVPSNEARDFDYSTVTAVITELNTALIDIVKHSNGKVDMPLVVLISTCLPGTVRREIAPLLTIATLIYNPYFIAMGTVEEDYKNPEFLAIGTEFGHRNWKVDKLIQFYKDTTDCDRFELGTWEEAEAMKIFYNTFITFKLCFVNMIQDVAMKVTHINTDVVTEALAKSSQRLTGPAYMKAGMGDGGPCHPRDNIALRWLAHRYDLGYDMFGSLISTREKQASNMASYILAIANTHLLPIRIIGKSFKPGTDLEDGSYTVLLQNYINVAGSTGSATNPVKRADFVGDDEEPYSIPAVYVIGHRGDHEHDYPKGSVIIDPWREMP